MKKIFAAMLFAAITFSASAQHFHGGGGFGGGGGFYHGGGGFYGPRVGFGIGYPYYYSPFYSPYYPYYYPGYGWGAYRHSNKLDLQIQDIKNDYKQRIWETRHDKSIPRKERRRNVRQLKHDEDQAIINAQRNYNNKQ